MKLRIEKQRCVGNARCWTVAPEVFTLDEDGYISVEEISVPEELRKSAWLGARSCPEKIIQVISEGNSPNFREK